MKIALRIILGALKKSVITATPYSMTNIHFSNDRPAYTYLPEVKDEMTGESVEGTGMLTESHLTNIAKDDQLNNVDDDVNLTEDELIEADPDYVPSDLSPVDLAEITSEIYESSASPSPDMADQILRSPMSDSAADTTITFLAHKFYQGEVTADEAYQEAINSGLPPEALAQSFRKLQSYLR